MHFHSWAVWPMYGVGIALHMLLVANQATRTEPHRTRTIKEYLSWRWVPISCRIFLSILAFVLVWDNQSLINGIDRFMATPSSQIAIAGILGWFSDSLLDKVISLIPGLQGNLPTIPPPGDSSGTPKARQDAGAMGQKQTKESEEQSVREGRNAPNL